MYTWQMGGMITAAHIITAAADEAAAAMYSEKYICLLQYPAVGGNDHHLYGQ